MQREINTQTLKVFLLAWVDFPILCIRMLFPVPLVQNGEKKNSLAQKVYIFNKFSEGENLKFF